MGKLEGKVAAEIAGEDRLVLVVGPAGKTRMLAAATNDLAGQSRPVFGVVPTAEAARVFERDTGYGETVAMLLHEWHYSHRPPEARYRLPAGTSPVVDEAGTISTPNLSRLVGLAETQRWQLVVVGDHRQRQAIGRGGLFAELCANGRVEYVEHLHRFTYRWEDGASLQPARRRPAALDRLRAPRLDHPRSLDTHLESMAQGWIGHHQRGQTFALIASTNDHVDAVNRTM